VELPGYQPFDSGPLDWRAFPQRVEAKLEPSELLGITLLNPDGSPALETTLQVVSGELRSKLVNGEMAVKHKERPTTRLLPWGTFKLTPPRGEFAVMAINDSGYLRLMGDELLALPRPITLTLEPWACIEGNTTSPLNVTVTRTQADLTQFRLSYANRPTPDGHFHICDLPAGNLTIKIKGQDAGVQVEAHPGETVSEIWLTTTTED